MISELTGLATTPAFVGRASALAAVTGALARGSALVLIEGEAGIGKTRLLHEALARVRQPGPGQVLITTCPPFRESLTLGPIVDAVRQAGDGVVGLPLSALAGALRPLYPEWAADLPPAPEPLDDARAARHRLFRALAELVSCLNVSVLAVEDVHWADDATLEFLLYLASRQRGRHDLGLMVTYRPEDVPAGSLVLRLPSRLPPGTAQVRVALPALSVPETAALVSSMLAGEPISDAFAAFLHERTDGVPLAVEESVRLLRDRSDLVHHDGEWIRRSLAELQVPPTVRDAVLERLWRHRPATRRILQAAAVLAEPVGETTLRAVAGLAPDKVAAGTTEALSSGLLGEDGAGRVAFRHALQRQAVYEAIPAPERRRLHLAAGTALEGTDPLPVVQLTRHFREANDIATWCRYAERAADQAVASSDHSAAGVLLYDLLAVPELKLAVRTRLARKAAAAALLTQAVGGGRAREIVHTLRAVLDSRGLSPGEQAEIRSLLGRLLLQLNDAAAYAELEHAATHPDLSPIEAARVMTKLGSPDWGSWPGAVHLRWLRRAAALPDASMTPSDRLGLTVDRATALLDLGEEAGWAVAAGLPTWVTDAEDRLQLARGHLNIGESAIRWGHYAEARRLLSVALELAEAHHFARIRDMARAKLARLDWLTGAWERVAQWVPVVAEADGIEPLARPEIVLVAGQLHATRGARHQAAQSFSALIDQERQGGSLTYALEPAAALGWLRQAEGRVEEALQVTDEPMQMVATRGIWMSATEIAPARVAALIAAGRIGEARRLVTRFARGLRGRTAPAPRAALAYCRALLAGSQDEPARAAAAFARAARLWERLPRPYDALLTRERQARCLLAADDPDLALGVLSEVFHGLATLGAHGDADRVARELRRCGVSVPRPWRGGRTGFGDRLSPRELDIVRLVVAGKTNAQIARALSKAQPTVSTQLRSAMRKLSVSSRTALAVKAIAEGIVPDESMDAA